MSSLSSRFLRPGQWVPMLIVAAALVSVGVAGGRMQARPTAVATVDLSEVLENLDQRAAMFEEILTEFQGFQNEAENRAKEQTAREEQLEPLEAKRQAGTITAAELEQYMTIRDEAVRFRMEAEALSSRAGRTIDREMGLALEELYISARDQASQLARANGYDVVIVDDSSLGFEVNPQASRRDQIQAQMRRRRVLFTADSIDITQALIDRMNNAFKAGG